MSAASGQSTEDLASSLLGAKGGSGLEACFAPQNVAVIGATEKAGSIGRTLVRNLISSPFGGTVFPINPKRRSVLGIKVHPRVGAVPDPIDLAIVATPALRDRWSQVTERLSSLTPDAVLALGARLSLGAIFFMSGRSAYL